VGRTRPPADAQTSAGLKAFGHSERRECGGPPAGFAGRRSSPRKNRVPFGTLSPRGGPTDARHRSAQLVASGVHATRGWHTGRPPRQAHSTRFFVNGTGATRRRGPLRVWPASGSSPAAGSRAGDPAARCGSGRPSAWERRGPQAAGPGEGGRRLGRRAVWRQPSMTAGHTARSEASAAVCREVTRSWGCPRRYSFRGARPRPGRTAAPATGLRAARRFPDCRNPARGPRGRPPSRRLLSADRRHFRFRRASALAGL
jgi:hypothetical protein